MFSLPWLEALLARQRYYRQPAGHLLLFEEGAIFHQSQLGAPHRLWASRACGSGCQLSFSEQLIAAWPCSTIPGARLAAANGGLRSWYGRCVRVEAVDPSLAGGLR
jgi:hypothetical protein